MPDPSSERILRYYTDVDEAARLRNSWFQLEHERTREFLSAVL